MGRVKIPLQFSASEMGHPEYGFIPRSSIRTEGAAEEEDAEYARYLRQRHPEIAMRRPVVVSGSLWLDPVPKRLPELAEMRAQRLASESTRMPEPDGRSEEQDRRILRAREEINAADPSTRFGLISAACELVARGWKPDVVSDALYEELAERGLMPFDSGDGR